MSVVGDHDEHALENCIITHTSKSIQCDLIKREPRFKLQSFPGARGGGRGGIGFPPFYFLHKSAPRTKNEMRYLHEKLPFS